MLYAMLLITAKMENIEKQETVVPENMYPEWVTMNHPGYHQSEDAIHHG